ncbi:hypothetical protein EUX98_g3298 [Antrodiella citrinella]|uniref:Uncharacterized protein n=1 Tax=Antrodiella citrinella TaxID=2447956 RepID=A0A4S4MWX8_9APHY|nr:hypothetical protein EUX98_g3298 [Antrodiella citrinella]
MVDVAPNYELNTPNAGSIVSTSSFPDYPPPSGSVLRPSNNVDQANVIVALTILAVVGMICVTASVMLTRRSTIVTRWGEFATMTYYPDLFPANAVPRDRRRRVRVPRIWDVIVAPGGSGSVEESKRYEQWEDIKVS